MDDSLNDRLTSVSAPEEAAELCAESCRLTVVAGTGAPFSGVTMTGAGPGRAGWGVLNVGTLEGGETASAVLGMEACISDGTTGAAGAALIGTAV